MTLTAHEKLRFPATLEPMSLIELTQHCDRLAVQRLEAIDDRFKAGGDTTVMTEEETSIQWKQDAQYEHSRERYKNATEAEMRAFIAYKMKEKAGS